jgi:hypothetical protein
MTTVEDIMLLYENEAEFDENFDDEDCVVDCEDGDYEDGIFDKRFFLLLLYFFVLSIGDKVEKNNFFGFF